jgi:hypothetical protein
MTAMSEPYGFWKDLFRAVWAIAVLIGVLIWRVFLFFAVIGILLYLFIQ